MTAQKYLISDMKAEKVCFVAGIHSVSLHYKLTSFPSPGNFLQRRFNNLYIPGLKALSTQHTFMVVGCWPIQVSHIYGWLKVTG
jgi:hypothetical protein